MSATYSGSTGRLRSGGRVIAELTGWTAEHVDERSLRVAVADYRPDPFWWEHRDAGRLVLDLDFGRTGLRGPAVIESETPLVAVVTIEVVELSAVTAESSTTFGNTP